MQVPSDAYIWLMVRLNALARVTLLASTQRRSEAKFARVGGSVRRGRAYNIFPCFAGHLYLF